MDDEFGAFEDEGSDGESNKAAPQKGKGKKAKNAAADKYFAGSDSDQRSTRKSSKKKNKK